MSGLVKLGIFALTLALLSSCSLMGRLGFGGKDECADGSCDTTRILENETLNKNWYCYGVPEDRSWDCGSEAQPGKVATVIPASPRPVRSEPAIPPGMDVQESSITAGQTGEQHAGQPTNSEEGADAIMDQPSDFYTVQLVAMQEEDRVLDYARQNGLQFPLYARIESQDSDWFVLLLGIYNERSAAQSARDEFEATRTLKVRPWIRQLEPLQEAIRLVRQTRP